MPRTLNLRWFLGGGFLLLLVLALTAQHGGVEAVEIGKHNAALLPNGKEADGIIGDFVLRNDKVQALVAGNLPLRRANMSTEYRFPVPGVVYDLDLVGSGNDQLTAFRPGDQGGELSWVRVASDGRSGAAAVEAVRTAAKGDGLYVRHEYKLERGWQHLLVTSTWRNESSEAKKITPAPAWKAFSEEWQAGEIRIGDSIDPFDKRAYAWAPVGAPPPKVEELAPGNERSYAVALAVADSPAAAYGVLAGLSAATGELTGEARDAAGAPAVHAAIRINVDGRWLPAYPDAQGRFRFRLPSGRYEADFHEIGREVETRAFTVAPDKPARLDYPLPPVTAVMFDIRDQSGQPSPAKVQFIGREGTPTPDLGTPLRAHGCDHQYHSHDGQFTQQAPPGRYLVRITRGPEYDLVEREIEVSAGQTATVAATLRRTVDTRGWISTDYHSHSTPSGDNYCNTNDRLTNFVAEQIEFAPTTEHNRIYDWQPYIDRLAIGRHIKTIIGIELTGSGQHFNSFPLPRTPLAQDGGAPVWNYDPRLNAIVLREMGGGGPDRWVQANHPIVGEVFNDRDRDGVADGGFAGFERLIDAAEVWSTEILNLNASYQIERGGKATRLENRTFGWLQMLNQGRHVWCVAVSDAHGVFTSGVGAWRTYVPSSTDDPPAIDHREVIRNSKAGRMMITNGPFLQVTTEDGLPIGSAVVSAGGVGLKVKVQAPDWMEIDRVQVLVNGRQRPQDNYTRASHPRMFRGGAVKFEETLRVALQEDAHLIVVAIGEKSDLSKGWGRAWPSAMHPLAYTNPIYVDLDGKGFKANGDTLGHPVLVAGRPKS